MRRYFRSRKVGDHVSQGMWSRAVVAGVCRGPPCDVEARVAHHWRGWWVVQVAVVEKGDFLPSHISGI